MPGRASLRKSEESASRPIKLSENTAKAMRRPRQSSLGLAR